jgi:hypothetical protein
VKSPCARVNVSPQTPNAISDAVASLVINGGGHTTLVSIDADTARDMVGALLVALDDERSRAVAS